MLTTHDTHLALICQVHASMVASAVGAAAILAVRASQKKKVRKSVDSLCSRFVIKWNLELENGSPSCT